MRNKYREQKIQDEESYLGSYFTISAFPKNDIIVMELDLEQNWCSFFLKLMVDMCHRTWISVVVGVFGLYNLIGT